MKSIKDLREDLKALELIRIKLVELTEEELYAEELGDSLIKITDLCGSLEERIHELENK